MWESCICNEANDPLSIQDSVAYQLNQWLDKRLTRSPFNIDLGPALAYLNSNELKYRQLLTRYAANDCDTIYQLIISMTLIDQQQQLPIQSSNKIDNTSQTINENINYELEPISSDDEEPQPIEVNSTNK